MGETSARPVRGHAAAVVSGAQGACWTGAQADLIAEPGEGLLVVADEVPVVAPVPVVVVVGFGVVAVVLHDRPGDAQ